MVDADARAPISCTSDVGAVRMPTTITGMSVVDGGFVEAAEGAVAKLDGEDVEMVGEGGIVDVAWSAASEGGAATCLAGKRCLYCGKCNQQGYYWKIDLKAYSRHQFNLGSMTPSGARCTSRVCC